MLLQTLTAAVSLLAGQAAAQAVFAHHIVGNTYGYTVATWESDIKLAASKGIDAFALNIAPPLEGTTGEQIKNAFDAAANAGGDFKLFFSFDYEGGSAPWSEPEILSLLQEYGSKDAHFKVDNKPFVSTFEGPGTADMLHWASIRASLPSGIYFIPDWASKGAGWNQHLVDGYFSWDMWPVGANNMTMGEDHTYKRRRAVSYMMGVSPWFYTDLPGYGKSWTWKGDQLWHERWQQVLDVMPDFVEIVTWNDFGESHYIGPIYEAGVPQGGDTDAMRYVKDMDHTAWLETLEYQIAAYKHAYDSSNPAPSVSEDKIVYWYRLHSATAGTTESTGNNCPSPINKWPYQECASIPEMLEDAVFAIALLSSPGSVSISIGDGQEQKFDNLQAGINFVSMPFGGQTGVVSVTSSSGVSGSGEEILAEPANGKANYNAWVGCAKKGAQA